MQAQSLFKNKPDLSKEEMLGSPKNLSGTSQKPIQNGMDIQSYCMILTQPGAIKVGKKSVSRLFFYLLIQIRRKKENNCKNIYRRS